MKKTVIIFLCLSLALCLMSGCGGDSVTTPPDEATPSSAASPSAETPLAEETSPSDGAEEAAPSAAPDKGAYADSDAVLTLDGNDVTWAEFFPWLLYSKAAFESSYGEVTDFSAEMYPGVTYTSYLMSGATGAIRYYKSVEKNAAGQGVALTEEDRAELNARISEGKQSFESEDAYNEYVEGAFGSVEQCQYILEMNLLYNKCFEKQYGAAGAGLDVQEVLDHAADDGYMMAKHILLMTAADDGTELPEEEKAALHTKMEGFLTELDACADAESRVAKFDELMNANTEDPGVANFPNGYLFQPGEMVEQFENAVLELGDYELSGIVESVHGYHIIMRLPIDVEAVPISYASYGADYTLRYITAEAMFSDVVNGWAENSEVTPTELYNSLDLAKIFG